VLVDDAVVSVMLTLCVSLPALSLPSPPSATDEDEAQDARRIHTRHSTNRPYHEPVLYTSAGVEL